MLSEQLRRLADIYRQNPPATQVALDRLDLFLRLASAEVEQLEIALSADARRDGGPHAA